MKIMEVDSDNGLSIYDLKYYESGLFHKMESLAEGELTVGKL